MKVNKRSVVCMTNYQKMWQLAKANNGYLFSKMVAAAGITRTQLGTFVKENNFERAAQGIYISPETWLDELYVLQLRYPKIIFSNETALYLHDMIDREYSHIEVTAPPLFSRNVLLKEGVRVYQVNNDLYPMGIIETETNFGNIVRCYDKERCICDLIKRRGKSSLQNFQAAIQCYMAA